MGTCDEISRILSFKRHVKKPTRSEKSAKLCKQQSLPEPQAWWISTQNMFIFIGLGTPKNGDEKKFVTKLCP